jgi:hypothetical protein
MSPTELSGWMSQAATPRSAPPDPRTPLTRPALVLRTPVAITAASRRRRCQQQPINPDDLVRKGWDTKAPQPAELTANLLPYQSEGLGWLLHQESIDVRGGILADEMVSAAM